MKEKQRFVILGSTSRLIVIITDMLWYYSTPIRRQDDSRSIETSETNSSINFCSKSMFVLNASLKFYGDRVETVQKIDVISMSMIICIGIGINTACDYSFMLDIRGTNLPIIFKIHISQGLYVITF